jgi:hypothetical protein
VTRQYTWQQKQRAAGKCVTCGAEAGGASRCDRCAQQRRDSERDKQRLRMRARRAAAKAAANPAP